VEIISGDTLRVVLPHLHKVIFNCLYRRSKNTLTSVLVRFLICTSKLLPYSSKEKETWPLIDVKMRMSALPQIKTRG
jgi:hypothetical protein